MAARSHLFPFRTEKLSSLSPMVLNFGRVGSRRFQGPTSLRLDPFFCLCGAMAVETLRATSLHFCVWAMPAVVWAMPAVETVCTPSLQPSILHRHDDFFPYLKKIPHCCLKDVCSFLIVFFEHIVFKAIVAPEFFWGRSVHVAVEINRDSD